MERLLVVEHNRLFREGLALLLEWRTGLRSVYAESLAEANGVLEETNHKKPACIIIDLDLPEGEGTELLKQLDGIPVLALIRSQNLERRAEAIELGADEVLRTTGPAEKIAAAVDRLIGRWSYHQLAAASKASQPGTGDTGPATGSRPSIYAYLRVMLDTKELNTKEPRTGLLRYKISS
jgi:DNA-binding NarL/FixJ family response regulator